MNMYYYHGHSHVRFKALALWDIGQATPDMDQARILQMFPCLIQVQLFMEDLSVCTQTNKLSFLFLCVYRARLQRPPTETS